MKKAPEKFKVGDVVRLKSGGLFTVLELGEVLSSRGAEGTVTIANESNTIYVREPERVLEPAKPKGSRLASGASEKAEEVLGYVNFYAPCGVRLVEVTAEAAAARTCGNGQLCKLVAL